MSLVPAAPTPAFVFSSALVIGCGYAFASVSCYARGEVGERRCFARVQQVSQCHACLVLFQWACTSQGYPTDLQTILMLSSRYYTSRHLKFASRFTLPTNLTRPVAILLLWWQLCGAQHCRHPGRRVWLPSHCLTLLHHLQLHGPAQHCHPSPKRAADCQEEGQSLHDLNTAIGMSCNVPSPPNNNKKKSQ